MNAMQPPQSVEEIKAGLETTEKGGVRQSIRNCLTVFQRDPLLSGAIAYNILTDRKDIIKPIGFHRDSTALNDTDMKYLLLYLEETYGLTNEKKIDNAIQMPKVTPHVCRHTFCSNMAKSGMNPKTLQYIMGHADISVTLNTYTHVNFDDAKEEVYRIANS